MTAMTLEDMEIGARSTVAAALQAGDRAGAEQLLFDELARRGVFECDDRLVAVLWPGGNPAAMDLITKPRGLEPLPARLRHGCALVVAAAHHGRTRFWARPCGRCSCVTESRGHGAPAPTVELDMGQETPRGH